MSGMSTKPACLTFAVDPVANPTGTGPMRFRGVAYSGGVIPQYGWYGDACIDLASLSLPTGKLFALVDHDPTQRAGKFDARLENNAIIVEGELFTANEAGREVAALLAEGAPWQMSVGIQAETEQSDKRRAVQCNGQPMEVNTLFKNAVLREVSFVPVGADPQTSVQAFSRNLAGDTHSPVPHPVGDPDMTLEELQTQVAELSAKLEAETAARQQAEDALAAHKLAARQDAIKALSAEIGRDMTEAETAALVSVDEATYATLSATLLSLKPAKPAAPDHLFAEQATDGQGETPETAAILKAQAILRNQVSGLAAA
jgi:hypothetical protein